MLLFGQACATTVAATLPERRLGPATEADRATVERLRRDEPARIAAQAERLWSLWTTGEVAEPCADDECLGTPPSEQDLLALRRVRGATRDEEEGRALGLLEAHLIGERIGAVTAVFREKEDAIRSAPSLVIEGSRHSFQDLGGLLAREADHDRRLRAAAAAAPVLRALDENADATRAAIAALADRLGYRDAAELHSIFLPLPDARLRVLAEGFLAATDDAYRRALAEAARRELGLSPGELRRADLPRLFGGVLFEVRFPREGGREALERTFAGLALDRPASLRIDDERRPHRIERPACFPVAPPGDVRLALPSAPTSDWRPSFQEAACAWQATHAGGGRFEFTQLGWPGVARGLSLAVGDLPEAPAWLRRNTLLTEAEVEAQTAGEALQRLFVARRAAGKILASTKAMERALGVPVPTAEGSRWLSARDGGDSPREFVALLLGAMATDRLEALHGDAWWESPKAGETLVGWWRQGGRLDPDAMARTLGAKDLDAAPLARQLVSRLGPFLCDPPQPPAPKAPPPVAPPADAPPAAEPPADEPPPALSSL